MGGSDNRLEYRMELPTAPLPAAAPATAQIPLPQAVAPLGAQPAPVAAPAALPVTAAPQLPVAPFTVILTDAAGVEHPIQVSSAKLELTRTGALVQGMIELRAIVHANPAITTLMTIANITGAHSIMLRYFAPNGTILREDKIAINPTSRAIYRGPELSETKDGWEFFETLTIHA